MLAFLVNFPNKHLLCYTISYYPCFRTGTVNTFVSTKSAEEAVESRGAILIHLGGLQLQGIVICRLASEEKVD